ncbi:MAG: hypothetical protein V4703_12825 [Actinomycetota bacterium]
MAPVVDVLDYFGRELAFRCPLLAVPADRGVQGQALHEHPEAAASDLTELGAQVELVVAKQVGLDERPAVG